jgi:hypothetical protein
MGLEAYRYVARRNERQVFPDIPPSAGFFIKPSRTAINTDRYARTPIPPLSQDRALMVKYTHTLVW